MKISKREKIMLLILGIFGISILYYQFGYTVLVKQVEAKTAQKNDIEEKYNKAMSTINSMENQKEKVKILNAKIKDESDPFYPTINQEHLILELDKLIKDSGLEGGMSFEAEEVKGVESIKKSEKDKELPESSLQNDVDKYNDKYSESSKNNGLNEKSDNEGSNKSDQQKSTNSGSSSGSNTNTTSNTNTAKDAKSQNENTVTQVKVNIDFNGSYENVVKLLKAIGEYDKKIPVCTINMSEKNLEEVKGSINMIIYSVPKISDEMNEYLKWSLNNTYGKSKPFNIDSAVGTGIKSDTDASDFMISVKSVDSELPTITMGKANDPLRTTYAYGDGNSEQNAEIVLTQKDNKYYYKYKTSNDKIPINYDDLGNEFTPNSDNIVLNIQSESRTTSNDKSGLKLKIINNTDKLVMANISGDDTKDPRVSIDGDSKNISVNQK